MNKLQRSVIRLAAERHDLRPHLLPLLKTASGSWQDRLDEAKASFTEEATREFAKAAGRSGARVMKTFKGKGGASVHLESDILTDEEVLSSATFTWSRRNPGYPMWSLRYGTSPMEEPFDSRTYAPHKASPEQMAKDALASWRAQMKASMV